MTRCIVHDPPPADYDTRGQDDWLPSMDELQRQMSRHLAAIIPGPTQHFWRKVHSKIDGYCGECYEEFEIRHHSLGIEDILLEEDHQQRIVEAECTCPPGSPQTFYFLQALRYAYKEAS